MEYCSKCMKPRFIKNAYGETLCEECWEEYLTTEQGKVEHFIYLVEGKGRVKSYDADALGEIVVSWKNNKHLINLDEDEIEEIEAAAFKLGILE